MLKNIIQLLAGVVANFVLLAAQQTKEISESVRKLADILVKEIVKEVQAARDKSVVREEKPKEDVKL